MKKLQRTLSTVVPALALSATVFLSSQSLFAQSPQPDSQASQGMQNSDQSSTQKTFTGTITKAGDKLVLTDTASKTSYQLDDQQKAQSFLNKNVKVTGVLDASSGTIRVTSIDPM